MNMAGNHSLLPCTAVGPAPLCHNKEAYTNNTCVTHREPPFEYDMFDCLHAVNMDCPSNFLP